MSHYTNVRYGKMFLVGRFKTERQDLGLRDRCVVRTDRGKELGEVIAPLEPVPESMPPESLGDILRRAEPSDLQHAERLEKESVPRARQFFKEQVKRFNLPMRLVDVDYVFGGERVIFYFTSEVRVDFRELVRILAHEFRARIELKQVGARDEARLVGDSGHCGLGLCCRGYLKELGGISMDMAKVQKHTADPAKITGRCGKLLCCLRGEYSLYTEAREMMPPKGARIDTARGSGIVVEQNLLLREVMIEGEGGNLQVVPLEELKGMPWKKAPAPAPVPPPPPAEAPPPAAIDRETKVEGAAAAEPPPPEAPPAAEAPPPPPPAEPVPAAARAPEPAPAPRPQRGRRPYWIQAGKAAEFPPDAGRVADLGGLVLAVFNLGGSFHVLSNECPHQGGPLGQGKIEGTTVVCPMHQWKFDIPTGKGLSIPGPCARRYPSEVLGEDLYIGI